MISRSRTSGSVVADLVLALLDLAVEHGVGAEDEHGDQQAGDDDQRSMPLERPDEDTTKTNQHGAMRRR